MNKLAVIVLNWNGVEIIDRCIQSLLVQTHKNYSIIIVDNNSTDGSRRILEKLAARNPDRIILLLNDKNSGFAGGVNIGINHALENNFDAVALFNSDACADKEWLKSLSNILVKKSNVGIATGLLLHEGGQTIDSTGDWYSKWGLAFPRGRDLNRKAADASGYVFSGSGGASLYRSSLFREIGLFDEKFFAYYEDVDISFRAQLVGWRVYYTDKAIAYHEQGGSSKKIPGFTIKQTFRNLPLLFIKNVPNKMLFSIGFRFYIAYSLMLINSIKNGVFSYAILGTLQGIILTPQSLLERLEIQKKRRVTTGYIHSMLWDDLPPEQTGLRRFRKIISFGKIL